MVPEGAGERVGIQEKPDWDQAVGEATVYLGRRRRWGRKASYSPGRRPLGV